MHARIRLLLLLLLTTATGLHAADAQWTVEKEKDGIKIESRAVPGWDINEIRATTRFKARLHSIVAVIGDPAAQSQLNDLVVSATVENRESDARYQMYAVTDMPWPLTDRDVHNQRNITQDAQTGVVTIKDEATRDVWPLKKDMVRVVRSTQTWTLTPKADGTVHIQLQLLSDPAGPIPAALINKLSVNTPMQTLTQLKTLALSPKYANARLPFVSELQK